MAKTKSAKKATRAAERKHVFNVRRQKAMKDIVKEISKLAELKDSKAVGLLPSAYKAIDKAAKRGVVKRNAASRMKSRISKLLKKSSS